MPCIEKRLNHNINDERKENIHDLFLGIYFQAFVCTTTQQTTTRQCFTQKHAYFDGFPQLMHMCGVWWLAFGNNCHYKSNIWWLDRRTSPFLSLSNHSDRRTITFCRRLVHSDIKTLGFAAYDDDSGRSAPRFAAFRRWLDRRTLVVVPF